MNQQLRNHNTRNKNAPRVHQMANPRQRSRPGLIRIESKQASLLFENMKRLFAQFGRLVTRSCSSSEQESDLMFSQMPQLSAIHCLSSESDLERANVVKNDFVYNTEPVFAWMPCQRKT
jgi:hypothetical protein